MGALEINQKLATVSGKLFCQKIREDGKLLATSDPNFPSNDREISLEAEAWDSMGLGLLKASFPESRLDVPFW